jgi:ubiquinone/menaquinone biosynthesis C-methylase UbiE
MKQAGLFHPRVFDDQTWAEGYYKRNANNIRMTGKRLAQILKKTGFKGGKILDAGCGFCAVAIEIAKVFPEAEIKGIDLGEPLLELGKSLTHEANVADRIELSKGDVHHLDFEDDSFDVVISTYMLHIVEDPAKMLNEIERVAKNPGFIMITDLRRIWLALAVKKLRTAYTLKEAKAVIAKSSLRSGRFSIGPFWWDCMAGNLT